MESAIIQSLSKDLSEENFEKIYTRFFRSLNGAEVLEDIHPKLKTLYENRSFHYESDMSFTNQIIKMPKAKMNNEERLLEALISKSNVKEDLNEILEYLADIYTLIEKVHQNKRDLIDKNVDEITLVVLNQGLRHFYSSKINLYIKDRDEDQEEQPQIESKPMTEEEIKKELEEIQSHPMFMTEIPENIENNIAVQSLQALKYEGKPEDVAIELLDKSKEFLEKYKSTKNFLSLKESMYNICNSIEHVKEDSTVPDSVKFDLFFFRSEIQLMVKNYGYAVEDLKWALFYQKSDEAYMRLIECYIQLESYEKALKTIRNRKKTILETEPTSHSLKLYDLEEAKVKSLEKQLLKNLENLATFKNKENADKLKLYDLLMRKGIKVNTGNVNMYNIPQNAQANIYLDDDKILHFPVFIIYEEFNTTDYIQDVEENSTISDILQILLGEENSLPFDKEKKYNLNTSICYYENSHYDMILKKEIYTYYPLRNDEKLIDILTSSKVTMNGFPIISIVSQISKFFLHFVKTKEITKRTRFI